MLQKHGKTSHLSEGHKPFTINHQLIHRNQIKLFCIYNSLDMLACQPTIQTTEDEQWVLFKMNTMTRSNAWNHNRYVSHTCPRESFWEALLLLHIIIMIIVSILPIVLFGPGLGSSLSTSYCKNSTRNLIMRSSGGDSPTKTICGVRSRYVFYIINCHVHSPKSSVRD